MINIPGQLSLFDYVDNAAEKFCFDDDINEIVMKLDALTEKYGLKAKKSFSIWSHVPQYGYRLDYDISYSEEKPRKFYEELDSIILDAKMKKIELSPFDNYVSGKDGFYRMYIYSTYMDKERRKIKQSCPYGKQKHCHNANDCSEFKKMYG